jgi:cytidylate kinase
VNAKAEEPAPDPTAVVAIDGPSGAGKSTIAKAVAQQLGFQYLDTGAMYRAVTWHFLENRCSPDQLGTDRLAAEQTMRLGLASMELQLQVGGRVLVNGRDVTSHLRSQDVESRVSAVSALPFVRASMTQMQRAVAAAGPVVAEGRDMGSVVFPMARWKVYLTASAEERARRRKIDFDQRGRDVTYQQVLEEIVVRDRLDSTRQDAPLKQAHDAVLVDTTGLSTDAVVLCILQIVDRGGRPQRT